ncbi:GNAT family N-acetyltransferase [Stenotrophomonas sp.]|uniref:GNAT family N-acetyltransferase n=1 Tax=Stenotrophomonas sp. TaxID=69392 RepID=UPI0028A88B9B|nr:GNAT family N-acetyltransferase [Stenotrophomonas sp.]
MNPSAAFHVETADYAVQQALLHGVRRAVFVEEQKVPAELETDSLDPLSRHALAFDAQGQAIGAGRLTPDQRIGRMAVLAAWRGQGVGEALLHKLLEQARALGWGEVSLHAQLAARDFYARNGFLPQGPTFVEAGIEHQTMRQRLDGAMRVQDPEQAAAATTAVIHSARRHLRWQIRGNDALLAQPQVLAALRRFATARHDKQVQLLLHASDLSALPAAFIALVQRLPSVFQLREPMDPADCQVASAGLGSDSGACYFRPIGARCEGEFALAAQARAHQQEELFQRIWERSRDCAELRVLGV